MKPLPEADREAIERMTRLRGYQRTARDLGVGLPTIDRALVGGGLKDTTHERLTSALKRIASEAGRPVEDGDGTR